jgi:hypothetical protein
MRVLTAYAIVQKSIYVTTLHAVLLSEYLQSKYLSATIRRLVGGGDEFVHL